MLDPRSGTGRALARGFDALAVVAGWALFALSVLVGFEVIARKFLSFSIKGVDEIGGYVLAVTSAIGFICCLVNHGHIRVDVLFKYLGPRLRAILHLVAYLTLAAFAVLLAWRGIAVWLISISLDAVAPTPLATPLVIPQGFWILGLAIFALLSVALTVDLAITLIRNGAADVERRFHADRLDEELKAEQRDAVRRGADSGRPAP